jgi:hypothetical protein
MPDKIFIWAKEHMRDLALLVLIVINTYSSFTTNYALLEKQVIDNTDEIKSIKETMFTAKDAENFNKQIELNFKNVNLQLDAVAMSINEIKVDVKDLRK